ncbi:hypothetical protein Q4601_01270 [Shewanella sp. 1_MG-2023]|uniref:protein YgfX n=1 Tax=unclassified Shewanella TaxID=196818 RepID=UPI0026E28606|nr:MULTISPECIES: protein YgfX [unclassified Shewanella]MDO6610006.1 hypothetical protein [Shewanella sp. 7_MG-2023]MDO6769852.1 hypothetical protein [Shewanella sp. 2_MG-2023]MDO6792916.1 hypothetical protein [Shewanella sp. 1_MG-2023]
MHVTLSASFNQFLSHIVLICVCLTSFLLWPVSHFVGLSILRGLTLLAVTAFFIWHINQLRRQRCDLYLSETGDGTLDHDAFVVWRSAIVTVFACVIFIEFESSSSKKKKRQLLIVWSDMLTDKDYRQLCRHLNKLKRNQDN